MTISAKLLDIEPRAEYDGVVYTQDVHIRLPTGRTMWVFDDEVKVSDQEINKTKQIELRPTFNVPDVSVHQGIDYGIDVISTDSGEEHVFRGQIKNITPAIDAESTNKDVFELDVGCGTIQFLLDNSSEIGIVIDDEIKLPALRSDLKSIVKE